jgi:AraC family ethanolamine operon transcriptional activator
MREIIHSPVAIQHHFANFEVFASTLGGYDIDVKQIDCGSFKALIQQIQCGAVFINRFTFTRRIEINGNPPPGVRTFGIPTENCQPFIWRGQPSDGNTIQIYKSSTELELITNPEFEAIDVSISDADFNALNSQWGLPDLDEIVASREMATCDPAVMHRLRKTLRHICQVVDSNPDELNQNANLQNLVKNEVPYMLAQALVSSEVFLGKASPYKRSQVLKKALEYIQSTTGEVVSIRDFCRHTGVHERTLQRAFFDTYGTTPKYYMRAFRLNNAYKALLNSDADTTTVTNVAINLGYCHMSQFAADYHNLFGELPSETLHKN